MSHRSGNFAPQIASTWGLVSPASLECRVHESRYRTQRGVIDAVHDLSWMILRLIRSKIVRRKTLDSSVTWFCALLKEKCRPFANRQLSRRYGCRISLTGVVCQNYRCQRCSVFISIFMFRKYSRKIVRIWNFVVLKTRTLDPCVISLDDRKEFGFLSIFYFNVPRFNLYSVSYTITEYDEIEYK